MEFTALRWVDFSLNSSLNASLLECGKQDEYSTTL